jgi:bisphosphoglycerate-independent phosphoglycerate mutase (AlkP superfamily)
MKEAIDFGMSIVAYVDPDNVVHNGDNERTMKTVSRTIRLTDVARIREVCRTAGIRLAVQVDAETAELIVLHQDATKFVRLLDNELSR